MSPTANVNVLLTFDFEEWEGKYDIYEADLYSKTKRIVNLLVERELPATFFLDAYTTLKYPDAAGLVAEGGFELALHSDYHPGAVRIPESRKHARALKISDFRQDSKTQITRIQKAIQMIRKVIPSFKPKGFRAPCLQWNEPLYTSLRRLNFMYDSSQKENLFRAFLKNGVVVFPVNCGDYDSACYKTSTRYVVAVWKDNFRKAYQTGLSLGKSYFLLLAHPSVSGKSRYLCMLKAILNHISWADAKYVTCQQLAEEYARKGLEER